MKFLILIVGLVILYFLKKLVFAFIDDEFNVKSQGGMKKKYAVLIEHLMHCEPRLKILEETNTYIAVGIARGETFHISHFRGTVEIELTIPVGNSWKRIKWEFPENMDQHEMFMQIDKTIANKLSSMF